MDGASRACRNKINKNYEIIFIYFIPLIGRNAGGVGCCVGHGPLA
jgi:hypothetical protein